MRNMQPRLTALLACQDNLMPLSWHMPVSKEPFRYAVAVREENYTHHLLREHKSFTLNFLPFEFYESVDEMGAYHGNQVDKYLQSPFKNASYDPKGNLLLEEAYMIYECALIDTYQNGDHTIFIADVTSVCSNENAASQPMLFLGKGEYATIASTQKAKR